VTVPDSHSSIDLTGIAVAIGEIKSGQEFIRSDVTEMKASLNGVAATVALHSVTLQEHKSWLAAHDQALADRKKGEEAAAAERKPKGWPVYLTAVLGVLALIASVSIAVLK